MHYECKRGCCKVSVYKRRTLNGRDLVMLNGERLFYADLAKRLELSHQSVCKRVANGRCLSSPSLESHTVVSKRKFREMFDLAKRFNSMRFVA